MPQRTSILSENVANMVPSWLPNRAKIDKKSMQKSIEKVMHLGIDFWKDVGGFLEEKWRHVGTKIAKIDPNFEDICLGKELFFP